MNVPPKAFPPPLILPTHQILATILKYNELMRNNTTGPNCVDKAQCRGDCCSIMIDIPRILAELYIQHGWLAPADLRRGGPFAFRLGVSDRTAKCIFFDLDLNGCRVHFTGYKPPQCWIYPAGFTLGEKTCKKHYTWNLVDAMKAHEAEGLLEQYKVFGVEEARGEVSLLRGQWKQNCRDLKEKMSKMPPSRFVGLNWGAESLSLLDAGGFSLQTKAICRETHPHCQKDFMECEFMCEEVNKEILNRFATHLDLFYQSAECVESLQLRDVK